MYAVREFNIEPFLNVENTLDSKIHKRRNISYNDNKPDKPKSYPKTTRSILTITYVKVPVLVENSKSHSYQNLENITKVCENLLQVCSEVCISRKIFKELGARNATKKRLRIHLDKKKVSIFSAFQRPPHKKCGLPHGI
uniref:Uncharacterized protein n=1 Tax=Megaselia scalaris TaxID=36166 RepID=T1GR36_MEGSC